MHIVGTNDIPFYPMLLTNLRICLRNSFILTGSTFIIARSSAIDVIITIFILEIPYSFISFFKFLSSFYPICFFLICFIFATWLRIYVLSTHFLGFQENSVQRSCGSYSWAIFQANHETLSRDQSGIGKCGHTRRSLKPINWFTRITRWKQFTTIKLCQFCCSIVSIFVSESWWAWSDCTDTRKRLSVRSRVHRWR